MTNEQLKDLEDRLWSSTDQLRGNSGLKSTEIDRAHRKCPDEQIKNIAIISRLYEGKSGENWALIEEYKSNKESSDNKESNELEMPIAENLQMLVNGHE